LIFNWFVYECFFITNTVTITTKKIFYSILTLKWAFYVPT
jgi:hypothetical protein